MNERIYKVLEFEKVKQMLFNLLSTALGEKEVMQLTAGEDYVSVFQKLAETEDGLNVLRLRGGMPLNKVEDITPHIKRLQMGADLNGVELSQVAKVLRMSTSLHRFFEELKELEIELPEIYRWEQNLVHYPSINGELKKSIAEDGSVKDEASVTLAEVRRAIKRSEAEIRGTLSETIRGNKSKYLSDTIITRRNDRFVIPVKQEYKNIFGGVVHDQSSSGQTLFIEPKNIVELNNRMRSQQISEREEIKRIFSELSALLEPIASEILNNARIIGHLDFIEAKARLAKEMNAVIPKISSDNFISLKAARHPLIPSDKIVANDLLIGKDYQAIVITGPNTGGKTICLKTIGLLQLMAQSGLAIPVQEESEIGIFTEIFADIGDEQSIEQSLSTFSSHMTNIVAILDKIDEKSLVLFDELGAGTDPQEGATLAIAILDKVAEKKSYVLASTHYPELKVYGYNRKGVRNASMEFDVDSLRPTYRLMIGVPGRSNAYEISKRLGLSSEIIQNAKEMMDSESQGMNEMIADLENQRKMAETEYFEARENVVESDKLRKELQEMYDLFLVEREKLLEEARNQANEIVKSREIESEKVIQNLRKMQVQAESSVIKEHQIIQEKTNLNELYHQEQLKKNKVLKRAKKEKAPKVGDDVLVSTYGQRGTLVSKNKEGSWVVQIGILKMNVSEDEFEVVAKEKQPEKTNIRKVRSDSGAARSQSASQIDLRGERYEDALAKVDTYLDAAILSGYGQVTIVHGKGTGALREGVTEYLKRHRSVKKFEFAPANAGGNGATIVTFK